MTRLLALLLLAPLLASLVAPLGSLHAQGIDLSGGGPVDVTATDGIEWRQTEQVIVARRDARAVRGDVTVDADRLLARYRPTGGAGSGQAPGSAATPARPAGQAPALAENPAGGSSEIWRLEAEGRVTIRTATDTARGDRAVYDMDQAVLVLTGRELSLTTPSQVLTARDSLEYWSQRRMAVARGNAVAVDNQEGRRIGADTLVSYLLAEGASAAPAPVRPAAANGRSAAPPPGAGKVDRVEAFGNVEIRTPTEVVRGDRGVYSPATGMARLLGNVRITRGDNQVNGREAIVNLRTGVARLISAADRGERVRGLIVPQQDKPGAVPVPGPQTRGPQAPTTQAPTTQTQGPQVPGTQSRDPLAAPQQGRRP